MLWLLLNVRADVVLVTDWWIAFRFEDEWRPDWFRRWSVSPCVFILSISGSRSRVWLAPARMNARVVMNLAFVSPPTAKQRPAWLPVWERHCLPGPGQGSDLCRQCASRSCPRAGWFAWEGDHQGAVSDRPMVNSLHRGRQAEWFIVIWGFRPAGDVQTKQMACRWAYVVMWNLRIWIFSQVQLLLRYELGAQDY